MRTINVTIGPGGEIEIETKGFKGRACIDATKDLLKALGKVTSDTPTREIHEAERQKERA